MHLLFWIPLTPTVFGYLGIFFFGGGGGNHDLEFVVYVKCRLFLLYQLYSELNTPYELPV